MAAIPIVFLSGKNEPVNEIKSELKVYNDVG